MRILTASLFIFLVCLTIVGCKKKEQPAPQETPSATPSPLPTVFTSTISSITDSSAVGGGTVTSEGTSAITAVGVCWDTMPTPTTLKYKTNNGAGIGNYLSNLTNLKNARKYYVRAYATNAGGTAYGNEVTFTTSDFSWRKINSASAYTITCMTGSGANIYAGTQNGIITSSDTGRTWTFKGMPGVYVQSITQFGSALFAVDAFTGGFYRSLDNGNTWNSILANFPYAVNVYDVSFQNTKLMAGTDSSAFYSTDNGNTWTRTNNGLPKPVASWGGGAVYSMASDGPQIYTFASVFQGPGYLPTMFKYDETTNTWSQIYQFSQNTYVLSHKLSGGVIFLSLDNSGSSLTMKSLDGGTTWNPVTTQPYVTTNVYGSNVFLNNGAGYLSFSSNSGGTWSPVPVTGLPAGYNGGFMSESYLWMNTPNGVYRYKYN
jgi:hypothetical protein